MKIGDIVEYIDDWKEGRQWYLYEIYPDNLCTIVVIRDGKISENRNGEIMLHANIRNLPTNKIRKIII